MVPAAAVGALGAAGAGTGGALVAGAVTGGGLTVIANAPNPAGISILRKHFSENTINPTGLFLGALVPTIVSIIAFRLL